MPKKKVTPKTAVTPAKASKTVSPPNKPPVKRGRARSLPMRPELQRLMDLPAQKKGGRPIRKAAAQAEPAKRKPPVPIEKPESGEETPSSNEEPSEKEPSTDDGNETGDQIDDEPEDIPKNTNPIAKKGIICIILDYNYYYYLYYRI